jgi:hypothetical protein
VEQQRPRLQLEQEVLRAPLGVQDPLPDNARRQVIRNTPPQARLVNG